MPNMFKLRHANYSFIKQNNLARFTPNQTIFRSTGTNYIGPLVWNGAQNELKSAENFKVIRIRHNDWTDRPANVAPAVAR